MARICVLLCLALVSVISLSGTVAQNIAEVKLGDTDSSISHLTSSEEIIGREGRSAEADGKKKRKKAGKGGKVEKKKRRKNGNEKKSKRAKKLGARKTEKKSKGGKKLWKKLGTRKAGKKAKDKGKDRQNRKKATEKQKIRKKNQTKGGKYKKNRRNRKKNNNKLKKRKQKQSSCSSNEVSRTCMQNALDCMLFEKNQITNWLKQAKRLENHETISTNKNGKKGEFEDARKHLEWAIGGDKSNPKCGPNTTAGRDSATGINGEKIDFEKEQGYAVANLTLMENCSATIEEACNPSNLDGVDLSEFSSVISTCRSLMTEFNDKSKECRGLTESVSSQCQCWSDLTVIMAEIKEFDCKRIKATQKLVTSHKADCIKVFSKCKRSEDHAVEAVYSCMEDHSMAFINQSLLSLAEAAVDGAKVEERFREFTFLSA